MDYRTGQIESIKGCTVRIFRSTLQHLTIRFKTLNIFNIKSCTRNYVSDTQFNVVLSSFSKFLKQIKQFSIAKVRKHFPNSRP